jgi:hypothetical protein
MVTKEGVDEKLPIGILSLQNHTQKMMEDSSEIRDFIMNDMFDNAIEEYFVKNDLKIKAWIKDFKTLTGIDTTHIFDKFQGDLDMSLKAFDIIKNRPYGFLMGGYDINSNSQNKKLYKIIGEEAFNDLAKIQEQYLLKTKKNLTIPEGLDNQGKIRYKINFNHYKNVIFEILNLVLMLSSDGMNKFVFYSIGETCLKERRYTGEGSIILTQLSRSKKYRLEFLKAVYSKNSKHFFEYLESQILSSLKERTQSLLKNNLTLKDVLNCDVPLNMLTDEQIINSFGFKSIKVSDLKTISKLTGDKKQFDRMMRLFERFVEGD